MPDIERSYVTEEYARAFEAGALAALDHVTDERPDLEDMTMVAAERIGRTIDAMLGRGLGKAADYETHIRPVIAALEAEVERLREAEAHLWALVVHFGGRGYSPYVQRDVNAAEAYVNEHLAAQDMIARHRAALDA